MARRTNPYAPHPAVGMAKKWAADLPAKTGRSVKEWVALVRKSGPAEEKERRAWLVKEHGLPRHTAWWLAERAEGRSTIVDEEKRYLRGALRHVERQYSGKRAALRPIYDRLLELGLSLGKDVKVSPCKTMVPFYRKFAFAEVHAGTNGRVDLLLALGDAKPVGRLERIRTPARERMGHRITLVAVDGIDGEVEEWMRAAYGAGNEAAKCKAPSRVPAELAAALKRNGKARAVFEGLAPSHRGEWIRFIDEAKRPETKAKRVARALERLSAGKKTTY